MLLRRRRLSYKNLTKYFCTYLLTSRKFYKWLYQTGNGTTYLSKYVHVNIMYILCVSAVVVRTLAWHQRTAFPYLSAIQADSFLRKRIATFYLHGISWHLFKHNDDVEWVADSWFFFRCRLGTGATNGSFWVVCCYLSNPEHLPLFRQWVTRPHDIEWWRL